MKQKYITHSPQETSKFVISLLPTLKGGDIIIFQGPLGAGKTTFVKSLAKALGIKQIIKSPTFTLMNVYKIPHSKSTTHNLKFLIHCDAYRIDDPVAWHDIGLTEWSNRDDALVLIEWGEKIKTLLKGHHYKTLLFQHGKTESERIITIS